MRNGKKEISISQFVQSNEKERKREQEKQEMSAVLFGIAARKL